VLHLQKGDKLLEVFPQINWLPLSVMTRALAWLNLNILRKIEKKWVSAKRRMMHAALDSDFLYDVLFSE
jgi:hypothetical protein